MRWPASKRCGGAATARARPRRRRRRRAPAGRPRGARARRRRSRTRPSGSTSQTRTNDVGVRGGWSAGTPPPTRADRVERALQRRCREDEDVVARLERPVVAHGLRSSSIAPPSAGVGRRVVAVLRRLGGPPARSRRACRPRCRNRLRGSPTGGGQSGSSRHALARDVDPDRRVADHPRVAEQVRTRPRRALAQADAEQARRVCVHGPDDQLRRAPGGPSARKSSTIHGRKMSCQPADELDRRAHVADRRGEVARRPVRRVRRHLVDPLAEVGHLRAERRARRARPTGIVVEARRQRAAEPLASSSGAEARSWTCEQQHPRQRRVERDAAAPVRHPAELRRGHRRRHRVDDGRRSPMHDAHVARPDRPDRPGVPRLIRAASAASPARRRARRTGRTSRRSRTSPARSAPPSGGRAPRARGRTGSRTRPLRPYGERTSTVGRHRRPAARTGPRTAPRRRPSRPGGRARLDVARHRLGSRSTRLAISLHSGTRGKLAARRTQRGPENRARVHPPASTSTARSTCPTPDRGGRRSARAAPTGAAPLRPPGETERARRRRMDFQRARSRSRLRGPSRNGVPDGVGRAVCRES